MTTDDVKVKFGTAVDWIKNLYDTDKNKFMLLLIGVLVGFLLLRKLLS